MKACIEIGTFCMFSVRRCAVTVISSSELAPAPLLESSACALTATPPMTAATAQETFLYTANPPFTPNTHIGSNTLSQANQRPDRMHWSYLAHCHKLDQVYGDTRMKKHADATRSDSGMEHFGYRESLDRGIGKFGSFAAGVSYISILTGTFQLFYFGFSTAGPAYLWSWPMVLVGQLAVALCFMELAAKYPVAGSVYNWSKQLGSRMVGWSAGWLMLTASIVTLAAVVLALQLNLPRLWHGFQIVGDGNGAYDFATNAVILGTMLIAIHDRRECAWRAADGDDQQRRRIHRADRRLPHRDHPGPARHARPGRVLLDQRLWRRHQRRLTWAPSSWRRSPPGYVMYGFDTASSLGEETVEPRRTAPKAILRAILASFVIGGAILVFAILSAPNLKDPQIVEQQRRPAIHRRAGDVGSAEQDLPGVHRGGGDRVLAGRAHRGDPADVSRWRATMPCPSARSSRT